MKYKYSVLNTSRWEAATIVEWLLYYREIGFEHVYLYCNDDEPDELYQVLMPFITGQAPYVTFHHLPYQGQAEYCWLHFLEHHKQETEWFMFVDADEFLAIKGSNSIDEFMRYRQNRWDCINFNWIWFGPQDFAERPAGSTLLQFTRREDHHKQMNYFTKSLTRSRLVDVKLVERPPPNMMHHFWPESIEANLRSTNVLDYPFSEYKKDHPQGSMRYLDVPGIREAILDTACTYHYLFRSRADFRRRAARGLQGSFFFQSMWGQQPDNPDFEKYLETLHAFEDLYLKEFWQGVLGRASKTTLVSAPPYANLAVGSTPDQSSTCVWSKSTDTKEEAKGAITGKHTGGDGFHTDFQDGAWWQTDLGQIHRIFEVRVFNSLKTSFKAQRAYRIAIDISADGGTWTTIFTKEDDVPFGGVDGRPLTLPLPAGPSARYLRLRQLRHDFFNLDQVEIYGV